MNLRGKRVCGCGLGADPVTYSFEHNAADSGGHFLTM
jgi:hypothetical protein